MAISQNYKGIKNKYIRYLFFPFMVFFMFGMLFTIFILDGMANTERFVSSLQKWVEK